MKHQDQKLGLLQSVPGFSALRGRELARLAAHFDEVEVQPGAVLAHEGASRHELVLIVEGEVALSRGESTVSTLGPGEFLGALALLSRAPQALRATARTPMRMLVAGPSSTATLLDDPTVLRNMASAFAGRLRNIATARDVTPSTVA